MHREYTYIDGKVIISDENDKKIQSEYYDNLDKVLVQENLIETMEKKIQELEKENEQYRNQKIEHYIPVSFPMTALMSTIGVPLITNRLSGSNSFDIIVDTIFGTMSQAMAISITMCIFAMPLGVAMEIFTYREHKNFINREKGIHSELVFLKKQMEEAKENLEKLKQDKSRNNDIREFRTVKVDDLEQLKILKGYLNLYFDLGYNGEKYYQYYQQGKLDRKIQKHYSTAEIQVAKEYIEENAASLILKKKKNITNSEN